MSYWEDKGCLIYGIFLMWLGVVIGLPSLIFDSRHVGICGIIGISVGMVTGAHIDQKKDRSIRKEIPFTYAHFWMMIAYCVSAIITIGFVDIPYDEMRNLGKCAIFYLILPAVVLLIECITKDKTKSR